MDTEDSNSYQGLKQNQQQEGSGPPRLGENLCPQFDMYSLLFATTLHPEYLYLIKKEIEDRDETVDKLIEEQIELSKANEADD